MRPRRTGGPRRRRRACGSGRRWRNGRSRHTRDHPASARARQHGRRWRRGRSCQIGVRRRKGQCGGSLVFLERRLAAFHRTQQPALMVLPGLEPHHVVGRLIEEDRDSPPCRPRSRRRGQAAAAPARRRAKEAEWPPPPACWQRPAPGARREGRKIGRSRVAVSEESGIAQSGLPVGSAAAPRAAAAVGATSTGAGTTLLGGRSSAPGGLAPRASTAASSAAARPSTGTRRAHLSPPQRPETDSRSRMRPVVDANRSAAPARRTARRTGTACRLRDRRAAAAAPRARSRSSPAR